MSCFFPSNISPIRRGKGSKEEEREGESASLRSSYTSNGRIYFPDGKLYMCTYRHSAKNHVSKVQDREGVGECAESTSVEAISL